MAVPHPHTSIPPSLLCRGAPEICQKWPQPPPSLTPLLSSMRSTAEVSPQLPPSHHGRSPPWLCSPALPLTANNPKPSLFLIRVIFKTRVYTPTYTHKQNLPPWFVQSSSSFQMHLDLCGGLRQSLVCATCL